MLGYWTNALLVLDLDSYEYIDSEKLNAQIESIMAPMNGWHFLDSVGEDGHVYAVSYKKNGLFDINIKCQTIEYKEIKDIKNGVVHIQKNKGHLWIFPEKTNNFVRYNIELRDYDVLQCNSIHKDSSYNASIIIEDTIYALPFMADKFICINTADGSFYELRELEKFANGRYSIDSVVRYNDCFIFNRRLINELIKYNFVNKKIEIIKLVTEEYPDELYNKYYEKNVITETIDSDLECYIGYLCNP
jgi:hypothetical protein